ncbi:CO dehydrogenase/acetyl-CoA synthase subunit delta [Acetonema longum]|uniref:Acetyl-CoA decarbonylase/synthase complex subunit delta n=1 Tax=Acetonema longum DSM 6540 TaxID=1009370 RepID=F7NGS9_9FIRM|nr:CO dehydrogenase/acetyl-CoA synthase subunit delta [Acetonema longum]EGO64660.1 acetyl-CoA decarbonylase/synthase complex subunit delta [Acetonema longum DSM 6540]
MALQILKERNSGKITSVVLGATKEQGGTRTSVVTVGGDTALPFLQFEGEFPYKPVIAMEVQSRVPEQWNEVVKAPFADVVANPAAWAKKCVEQYGAEVIYLKLAGADPDLENHSPEECVKIVKDVLAAVGVPLIVSGCGNEEKDNQVMPLVAEATSGENLLLGVAEQENYKSIVAAAMVHKHNVIALTPCDINICKQLNILITEMGLPLDKIVVDPGAGGLGYGIEYTYSILERGRLGALQGDRMLSTPIIASVGYEAWRAKEANAPHSDFPAWGDQAERGILWEAMTATALLQGGVHILIMRHPEAIELVRKNIAELMVPQAV